MKTKIEQDGCADLEIDDIKKDIIQIWQDGFTGNNVILVEKDKLKELIKVLISIV